MILHGIPSGQLLVQSNTEITRRIATVPEQEMESNTQSFSHQNLRRSNSDSGWWEESAGLVRSEIVAQDTRSDAITTIHYAPWVH